MSSYPQINWHKPLPIADKSGISFSSRFSSKAYRKYSSNCLRISLLSAKLDIGGKYYHLPIFKILIVFLLGIYLVSSY